MLILQTELIPLDRKPLKTIQDVSVTLKPDTHTPAISNRSNFVDPIQWQTNIYKKCK